MWFTSLNVSSISISTPTPPIGFCSLNEGSVTSLQKERQSTKVFRDIFKFEITVLCFHVWSQKVIMNSSPFQSSRLVPLKTVPVVSDYKITKTAFLRLRNRKNTGTTPLVLVRAVTTHFITSWTRNTGRKHSLCTKKLYRRLFVLIKAANAMKESTGAPVTSVYIHGRSKRHWLQNARDSWK